MEGLRSSLFGPSQPRMFALMRSRMGKNSHTPATETEFLTPSRRGGGASAPLTKLNMSMVSMFKIFSYSSSSGPLRLITFSAAQLPRSRSTSSHPRCLLRYRRRLRRMRSVSTGPGGAVGSRLDSGTCVLRRRWSSSWALVRSPMRRTCRVCDMESVSCRCSDELN